MKTNLHSRRFYIRAACFLAAFAAIGAGSVFINHLITSSAAREKEAYEKITVSDFAHSFEELCADLAFSDSDDKKMLPDIRVHAALSNAYLGLIDIPSPASEMIFSYLSAVSDTAASAIENGIATPENTEGENPLFIGEAPTPAAFALLRYFAQKIADEALPQLAESPAAFALETESIFSDLSLDTLLSESGNAELIPDDGFMLLRGQKAEEEDALALARSVLGKKAHVKAEYSAAAPAGYRISGKNISAVVSEDGGFLLQMMFDTDIREEKMSEEFAREKAADFISERGLDAEKMRPSLLSHESGLFTFEFIPVSGNVLCKNERILVSVSAQSGRICLYDAVGYYRYHRKELPLPEGLISAEDIAARFALGSVPELCKITVKSGAEVFCYEISKDGVLITVNALTGRIIN